mmetsp:Transcript_28211/g.49978  ORF Transcript_28211/g.49978 Transcript_28211/m.49978 type:complete len:132 (+) Transcript_28211:33-428(+)
MLSFFRHQKENDVNTEQAAPETAGQVIISNDSDLQSVLGVTRCKLQADLLELQLGGADSVDSLRNILTSVTKQVDIIFSSVEKERELRISLQEQLQKKPGGDLQKSIGSNVQHLEEGHADGAGRDPAIAQV